MALTIIDNGTEVLGVADEHVAYIANEIPKGERRTNGMNGREYTWIKRMYTNGELNEGYSLTFDKEGAIDVMRNHYDFYSDPSNMGIIAAAVLFVENYQRSDG